MCAMGAGLARPNARLSGEARQQQIVETVLDLVAERGADDVSVQSIAERIGLTKPAVYRHFPTKEAIWIAVMTWLEQRLDDIRLATEIDPGQSALTILSRIFTGHLRMIERHPALA